MSVDLDQSWIYATPSSRHATVDACMGLSEGGGGRIDRAGLQTMCVPQGVVRGRLQQPQRVPLLCIRVSPAPTSEIKVITRPDE